MSERHIDPADWIAVAIRRHDENPTPWFPGDVSPARVGWYDRCFTDGTFRHWWDGTKWMCSNLSLAVPHWRQVGDYPCWRGTFNAEPPHA